jgi:glycosyltransferase involved in cell wall biosynthesis
MSEGDGRRLLTGENLKKSLPYLRKHGPLAFAKKVWHRLHVPKRTYIKRPAIPVLHLPPLEEANVEPAEDSHLSVIVPTLDGGPDLELLLSSLREQSGLKNLEIIVVDSGSSDETRETARAYGAKVIEMTPDSFSHSYSRNLGADHAAGPYLFFTVQDALLPSPTFLHELLSLMKLNGLAAVSCGEFPREDADLFYSMLVWNHHRFLEVAGGDRIFSRPESESHVELRKNAQLSDLACLIRKDTFMKYRYRNDYAEDLDLGLRLVRDGHRIAFLHSLHIIHSHNRPPHYFLKRGYVDNIFLNATFPDYPVPDIDPKALLQRNCAFGAPLRLSSAGVQQSQNAVEA